MVLSYDANLFRFLGLFGGLTYTSMTATDVANAELIQLEAKI